LEWVRFAIVVVLAVPAFVDAVWEQRAKNVRAIIWAWPDLASYGLLFEVSN